MHWLSNTVLKGKFVELQPLCHDHITSLQRAVSDGESWKLWFANVPTPEQMAEYVSHAITQAQQGNIAFAVKCKTSQKIVGTTRFYNVDNENKRAMLGYTWYCDAVRRTAINSESKLLLLRHLFDTHSAIAVEFRTHFFNHVSRKAIERLGAKQDGIIRNHQIMIDGSIRDTVIYSIIASEWPAVKANLLYKLG